MEGSEGLVHPMADDLPGQAVVFKAEGHLVGAVHGKKLTARILKNRGGQLADLADTHPCGVLSVQAAKAFQLSFVKLRYQPVNAPQQRGFSAPAASAKHHTASRRNTSGSLSKHRGFSLRILKFKFKIYHCKRFPPG